MILKLLSVSLIIVVLIDMYDFRPIDTSAEFNDDNFVPTPHPFLRRVKRASNGKPPEKPRGWLKNLFRKVVETVADWVVSDDIKEKMDDELLGYRQFTGRRNTAPESTFTELKELITGMFNADADDVLPENYTGPSTKYYIRYHDGKTFQPFSTTQKRSSTRYYFCNYEDVAQWPAIQLSWTTAKSTPYTVRTSTETPPKSMKSYPPHSSPKVSARRYTTYRPTLYTRDLTYRQTKYVRTYPIPPRTVATTTSTTVATTTPTTTATKPKRTTTPSTTAEPTTRETPSTTEPTTRKTPSSTTVYTTYRPTKYVRTYPITHTTVATTTTTTTATTPKRTTTPSTTAEPTTRETPSTTEPTTRKTPSSTTARTSATPARTFTVSTQTTATTSRTPLSTPKSRTTIRAILTSSQTTAQPYQTSKGSTVTTASNEITGEPFFIVSEDIDLLRDQYYQKKYFGRDLDPHTFSTEPDQHPSAYRTTVSVSKSAETKSTKRSILNTASIDYDNTTNPVGPTSEPYFIVSEDIDRLRDDYYLKKFFNRDLTNHTFPTDFDSVSEKSTKPYKEAEVSTTTTVKKPEPFRQTSVVQSTTTKSSTDKSVEPVNFVLLSRNETKSTTATVNKSEPSRQTSVVQSTTTKSSTDKSVEPVNFVLLSRNETKSTVTETTSSSTETTSPVNFVIVSDSETESSSTVMSSTTSTPVKSAESREPVNFIIVSSTEPTTTTTSRPSTTKEVTKPQTTKSSTPVSIITLKWNSTDATTSTPKQNVTINELDDMVDKFFRFRYAEPDEITEGTTRLNTPPVAHFFEGAIKSGRPTTGAGNDSTTDSVFPTFYPLGSDVGTEFASSESKDSDVSSVGSASNDTADVFSATESSLDTIEITVPESAELDNATFSGADASAEFANTTAAGNSTDSGSSETVESITVANVTSESDARKFTTRVGSIVQPATQTEIPRMFVSTDATVGKPVSTKTYARLGGESNNQTFYYNTRYKRDPTVFRNTFTRPN